MATGALYNKWRGQVFADILGQDHITKTLQNQIAAGRVAHAYLFAGMRGTGKTSTARIMAKAVNCVGDTEHPPCDRCHMCRSIAEGRSLDLIEIDGASNRGIDEIRQLRSTVSFAPSEGRYKIYVIDEVHMLTNEAFNALLKTLEEPPPHVVFILCTTAPHRLPGTVLSRCQRFDFRRATFALLLKKLRMICDQEKIAIEPRALEFVARRATGSFRDAESLLDQLASYSDGGAQITLEQVQSILGWVPSALVTRLVGSMISGDVPAGLRAINEAIDNGAEPRQFLREIIDHLRALLLLKVGGKDDRHALTDQTLAEIGEVAQSQTLSLGLLVRAIKLFNEAANGLRHAVRLQVPLELAFVEAALQSRAGSGETDTAKALRPEEPAPEAGSPDRGAQVLGAEETGLAGGEELTPQAVEEASPPVDMASTAAQAGDSVPAEGEKPDAPALGGPDPAVSASGAEPESTSVVAEKADSDGQAPARTVTLGEVRGRWQEVLAQVREASRRLEAVMRGARPIGVRGNLITIGCESPFHHGVLSEEKTCDLLARVVSEILGTRCGVTCVLDSAGDSAADEPSRKSAAPSEPLPTSDTYQEARQRLLDHPAVKELEKRGGRVSKVTPVTDEEQEDGSGQQA